MSYKILGRDIKNEHIALATFGAYGLLGFSMSGGKKEAKAPASNLGSGPNATAGPKTNGPEYGASSSDEEAFIKQFLAEAEGEKNSQRMV